MTPEHLVPTRETCEALVKAGIEIDTHFYWYDQLRADGSCVNRWVDVAPALTWERPDRPTTPAPTAEELLAWLRGQVDRVDLQTYHTAAGGVPFICSYPIKTDGDWITDEGAGGSTAAEALAQLALKVKEAT